MQLSIFTILGEGKLVRAQSSTTSVNAERSPKLHPFTVHIAMATPPETRMISNPLLHLWANEGAKKYPNNVAPLVQPCNKRDHRSMTRPTHLQPSLVLYKSLGTRLTPNNRWKRSAASETQRLQLSGTIDTTPLLHSDPAASQVRMVRVWLNDTTQSL